MDLRCYLLVSSRRLSPSFRKGQGPWVQPFPALNPLRGCCRIWVLRVLFPSLDDSGPVRCMLCRSQGVASTPALVMGRVDGRGHFVSEVIGALLLLISPALCWCWHQPQGKRRLCGVTSFSRARRRKGFLRAGSPMRETPEHGLGCAYAQALLARSPLPPHILAGATGKWGRIYTSKGHFWLELGVGHSYFGPRIQRVPHGAYCLVGEEAWEASITLHRGCQALVCDAGLEVSEVLQPRRRQAQPQDRWTEVEKWWEHIETCKQGTEKEVWFTSPLWAQALSLISATRYRLIQWRTCQHTHLQRMKPTEKMNRTPSKEVFKTNFNKAAMRIHLIWIRTARCLKRKIMKRWKGCGRWGLYPIRMSHLTDKNQHCCDVSVCHQSLQMLLPFGQKALFLEICLRE